MSLITSSLSPPALYPLPSNPERIDERTECRWLIPPTRIVKKVSRKRGAPVTKHRSQIALSNVFLDVCLHCHHQSDAIKNCLDSEAGVGESEWASGIYCK